MSAPKSYSRTRLFDTWETDYFADYTPKEFAVWLAGFFDGEGCVHLPPKTGIELRQREMADEVRLARSTG